MEVSGDLVQRHFSRVLAVCLMAVDSTEDWRRLETISTSDASNSFSVKGSRAVRW